MDYFVLLLVLIATILFYKDNIISLVQKKEKKLPLTDPIIKQPEKKEPVIETRDIAERLRLYNKRMIIFYGSQTGTAEDYSVRLCKEVHSLIPTIVADMEDYDMETLVNVPSDCVVGFLLATYGEGEPTDNAKLFYDWLMCRKDKLDNLRFFLFGLGNKTYEFYNQVANNVHEKLVKLGAVDVYVKGLGDDDGNLEEDFLNWKEGLWPDVCKFMGVENMTFNIQERSFEFKELNDCQSVKTKRSTGRKVYDIKNPYEASIISFKNLTPTSDRTCLHIEIDISKSGITYQAGDHLGIYPQNSKDSVEKLAYRLNIQNLDTIFTMTPKSNDSKVSFPVPTSYRIALSNFLDIASPPKNNMLAVLAEFAQDAKEKEHLLSFVGTTNKNSYHKYVITECRTLLDILNEHPSVKVPIDLLFEILPLLKVRFYSISSSSRLHPETIHLTVMRLEYETPLNKIVKGVATHWLDFATRNQQKISCFVQRSNFKLPRNPNLPVILIGPGTGIAPLRGFLEERKYRKAKGQPLGVAILFFGCRTREKDFLYEKELESYVTDGVLTRLITAFSRDQPHKVYVQDKIKEESSLIIELIDKASIYVCGDAKNMAKDVHKSLCEILMEHENISYDEATLKLKKMKTAGRFHEDVWS